MQFVTSYFVFDFRFLIFDFDIFSVARDVVPPRVLSIFSGRYVISLSLSLSTRWCRDTIFAHLRALKLAPRHAKPSRALGSERWVMRCCLFRLRVSILVCVCLPVLPPVARKQLQSLLCSTNLSGNVRGSCGVHTKSTQYGPYIPGRSGTELAYLAVRKSKGRLALILQ